MYNYYDRDASFPSDKASYKVLYNDYFHDSLITGISITPEKHCVELHIQCSRECEEETGDYRKDIYNPKYGYVLTFTGVTYLNIKTDLSWSEYINGRFKSIPKGKYYFRIQTADGFIDIGYRGFKLRKSVGRVSYRGIDGFRRWQEGDNIVPREKLDSILQRLQEDGYTEEDEFILDVDLEWLYLAGTPDLAEYLRRFVTSDWEVDTGLPYAAWLLSKYGNADDIPLIRRIMEKTDDPMVIQNLTDAIDALKRV